MEDLNTTPASGLIGTVLDGRYYIERELGRGGVGIVYFARHRNLHDKPVVVKLLLEKFSRNEWVLVKFRQEKEALSRVDHPGVVGILDYGELPDGKPYIVMQYVEGAPLRNLINAEPTGMDLDRVAAIVKQIGSALNAVHQQNILHRDLKPENIMIQPIDKGAGQVKVVDFGIAKVKESVVASSTLTASVTAGTINYMSPEQLRGEKITGASDIYSFGVIAYEMVTGRRPFNPDTAAHLAEMQREGVQVKPADLRPRVAGRAESLILQALSFDPPARFKSALEFGNQLSAALTSTNEHSEHARQGMPSPASPAAGSAPTATTRLKPASPGPKLEMAHVLFMDIVGYAKLLIESQTERVKELQEIVRNTREFQNNRDASTLLSLHTGDGMALSFFGDPEAPVRCAAEISSTLKSYPHLKLRMGLHSGLVQRVPDINANMNIAGGGINIAQRVMDCGDAGHILLSKRVAEDLRQLSRWADSLHDLGETEVKHGERVHIYNLHNDEIGNSAIPSKLRSPKSNVRSMMRVAALAVALVIVAIIAFAFLSGTSAERILNYSLTVQKMRDGKPYEEPFASSGQEIYENGYKFRLNVSSPQSGFLYVFNEGADENGSLSFTIIYPTPATKNGSAKINESEPIHTNWNTFEGQAGTEEFWIIWSASPVNQLEAARDAAFKSDEGALTDAAMVRSVKEFLTSHANPKPQQVKDKVKQQTDVRAKGELLVTLLDLEHR